MSVRPRRPEQPASPRRRRAPLRRCIQVAIVMLLASSVATLPVGSAYAAGGTGPVDVAAIDGFVEDQLARASIPGAAIAITHGDQVLHVRGFGHDSNRDPVTSSTRFRIASLSKSFTALAVMQLVDAGQLSLDDPVSIHLPEFRPADPRGARITVRQLLNQTSGLADREVPDLSRRQPTTPAEATADLNSASLVADPGTEFNYHNPNYQVAARLVEVISGETFEDYLRRHVFQPAGMTESLTTNRDNDRVAGLPDGHVLAYGRAIALPAPGDFMAGSGGVVSTAADMAQWLIVQAEGGTAANGTRLVSEQSMALMHTPGLASSYALGWDTVGPAGSPTRLEHNGNVLTFSAAEAILPRSGYGVALLFNSSSGLLLEQMAIFHAVLEMVQGTPVTADTSHIPGSTLDVFLAFLTVVVVFLGTRGVVTSGRWAARLGSSPTRAALRLLPYLAVLVLAGTVPDIVGWLLDGRDLTWVTISYGWPALVIFIFAATAATGATVIARAWMIGRRLKAQADLVLQNGRE